MKRPYKKPELKKVSIDKDISIMMVSTPPGGGGGGDPEWRKANPKNNNHQGTFEEHNKDNGPFKTD